MDQSQIQDLMLHIQRNRSKGRATVLSVFVFVFVYFFGFCISFWIFYMTSVNRDSFGSSFSISIPFISSSGLITIAGRISFYKVEKE